MQQVSQATLSSWSRRLKAGDREALGEVFEVFYPRLLTYLQRFTEGRAQAEDICQDAFFRLWEHRHQLDEERSLRALLFTSARNLALNRKRNAMNRERLLEEKGKANPAPSPAGEVEGRFLKEKMRGWIEALPERRREAFELSRFSGLSYKEIAEVMDVSVRTVENHIRLALQDLRSRLKREEPDLLLP